MNSSESVLLVPFNAFHYFLGAMWLEWLADDGSVVAFSEDEEDLQIGVSLGSVLYDPPGCYLPKEYKNYFDNPLDRQ